MTTIELARELGRSLQAEESYKLMEAASAAIDADADLTALIEEFAAKRENLPEDADEKTYEKVGAELEALYNEITSNPKMQAFEQAKNDFGKLMDRVLAIVTKSADGENPDTAEPDEHCCGDCCDCGGQGGCGNC